jgi:rhomboid protease GluP
MDANGFLFWTAAMICGAVAVRSALARNRSTIPWVIVPAVILACGLLLQWVYADYAGWALGGACALFVFVPLRGYAMASRFVGQRRYGAARRVARVIALLHPSKSFRDLPKFVDALQKANRGELDPAALAALDETGAVGRFATAHLLRVSGRWRELVEFVESLPPAERAADLNLSFLLLRALLELGELEKTLAEYSRLERLPAFASSRDVLAMMTAARVGKVELVDRLIAGPASGHVAPAVRAFWRATALQAAGRPEAHDAFVELTRTTDPETRRGAERRLESPISPVDLSTLSPAAHAALRDMEAESISAMGLSSGQGRSPATWLLLASFVAVFLLEIPGGSTSLRNMVRLGALLIPAKPGYGELFRLVSAAWLHLGPTHLIANGLALAVLGRRVESVFGSLRFLVLFLGSAVMANGVALLVLTGPMVIVGASGGVLGLLGAIVAVTLRRGRVRQTRFLRRTLWEMGIVVALQLVFDSMTPAISSTVHIAGLLGGFVLGFLLPVRRG